MTQTKVNTTKPHLWSFADILSKKSYESNYLSSVFVIPPCWLIDYCIPRLQFNKIRCCPKEKITLYFEALLHSTDIMGLWEIWAVVRNNGFFNDNWVPKGIFGSSWLLFSHMWIPTIFIEFMCWDAYNKRPNQLVFVSLVSICLGIHII